MLLKEGVSCQQLLEATFDAQVGGQAGGGARHAGSVSGPWLAAWDGS